MPPPDLTALQFKVLEIIGAQKRSGRFVRDKLADEGFGKTLAAFYQLMARLEDAKFVEGEYQKAEVASQVVQERWYKITGSGLRAYHSTRDFYASADVMRAAKGGTVRG